MAVLGFIKCRSEHCRGAFRAPSGKTKSFVVTSICIGAPSPSNLGEMGIVGARGRAPLQRFVSVGGAFRASLILSSHYCRGRRPRRPTGLHILLAAASCFPKRNTSWDKERGEKENRSKIRHPPSLLFPVGFPLWTLFFLNPFPLFLLSDFAFYGQAECLSVRPNIIEAVVFCRDRLWRPLQIKIYDQQNRSACFCPANT